MLTANNLDRLEIIKFLGICMTSSVELTKKKIAAHKTTELHVIDQNLSLPLEQKAFTLVIIEYNK